MQIEVFVCGHILRLVAGKWSCGIGYRSPKHVFYEIGWSKEHGLEWMKE